MKRLFVAIRVEPNEMLLETYERFRKWFGKENISWSSPDHFHVTLKFIGDTPSEKMPAIKAALKKVASRYTGFTAEIKGIGVFGSIYKPRVIWFGVEDPSGILTPLTKDLVGILEDLDIPDDRQNFVPHLTMGRIKYLRFKKKLEDKVGKYKGIDFQRFEVKSFDLYESQLTQNGPVYHVLERFLLKKSMVLSSKSNASSWWGRLLQRLKA